jgi:hypothetical protein
VLARIRPSHSFANWIVFFNLLSDLASLFEWVLLSLINPAF